MPSHLLTTTLSDLLHTPLASGSSMTMEGRSLPQGHHLVYFPLQAPASRLASDGADQDHAPDEQFTKRLWAGGEVRFGERKLVLDGRPWVCREGIGDVRIKGKGWDEKVFVGKGRVVDGRHDEG